MYWLADCCSVYQAKLKYPTNFLQMTGTGGLLVSNFKKESISQIKAHEIEKTLETTSQTNPY